VATLRLAHYLRTSPRTLRPFSNIPGTKTVATLRLVHNLGISQHLLRPFSNIPGTKNSG